jgi:DNA excision repair protein ERCC-2
MVSLKRVLDSSSSGILEMPTGTGKTATLLSFIISYQLANPENFRKLVYCTRTFTELEKTLKELRFVVDGIKLEMKPDELYAYEQKAELIEQEYLKNLTTEI